MNNRNKLCPCNSGRKYKHCCLRTKKVQDMSEAPAPSVQASQNTKDWAVLSLMALVGGLAQHARPTPPPFPASLEKLNANPSNPDIHTLEGTIIDPLNTIANKGGSD